MMTEPLTPERLAELRRIAEAATPEARDDGRTAGITVAVNHPSDPGNSIEVDYDKYRAQLDRGEPLSLEQASVLLELWKDGVRRFFREHEAWHRENERAEKAEVEAERWRQQYEALRAAVEPERCYGEESGRGEGAQLTTERRPMGIWLSGDDCNILMHGLRGRDGMEGHLIPEALERYEELCNRIIDVGTGYAGGAPDV